MKNTDSNIKIFTEDVEETALKQIEEIKNHPAFVEQKIRIMPDVHAGKGCVIGFTSTYSDKIVPNIVGVDIGCGVLSVKLDDNYSNLFNTFDMRGVDSSIRRVVPIGFNVHDSNKYPYGKNNETILDPTLHRINKQDRKQHIINSIGTLGGGNHFIEISKSKSDEAIWISVHSGSRNFGKLIAEFYQSLCSDNYPNKDLRYLEGNELLAYISDVQTAQTYARLNREWIIDNILQILFNIYSKSEGIIERIDTVHNYIDVDNQIVRKGAVKSAAGELLMIPMNMRDGTLLCRGKGNDDWNMSAPHGAGRRLSRAKAKAQLSIDDVTRQMENVYTTSLSEQTLDEAPDAYKNSQSIKNCIIDTVDIIDELIPIYNLKG